MEVARKEFAEGFVVERIPGEHLGCIRAGVDEAQWDSSLDLQTVKDAGPMAFCGVPLDALRSHRESTRCVQTS